MIKKTLYICGSGLLTVFFIWTIGLAFFVSWLKNPSVPDDSVDVVVVLTGGSERVSTGISLLKEKKAERLFISGVNHLIDFKRLAQNLDALPDDLSDEIFLGHVACNTYENALETKQWLKKNNINRFKLVTSAYHLPRSLTEFKFAMPDADIIPHPVFSDNVKLTRWWAHKGTTKLILSEYTKYLIIRLLHFLPEKYETSLKTSEGKCRP